ncbi:adenylate/guanylate cyclase domain-containing protein [Actomonas aquatica]|uniref:Adenylate/guanylate cyclase domain-containing protein n=1 Tax=Actomonas aquatica TaxID=2866162 RepID=A0ABZ1C5Z4_9BACT|nr:adenylate/guanylate cyclase domain-containing protein [Opitutus sp. WL0086]WRQ86931.1 adenylate/guanylate cyclase domain-containing protein [Opitutus sp. WL0086]
MASASPHTSPFARRIKWWRQLRFRAALAMIGLSLLVTGALFVTNYVLGRAELLNQFQMRVETIAGTGAVALRGEDLAVIEFQLDYLTDEFQQARDILEAIRTRNELNEQEIYILRPVDEADPFETEFVVMTAAEPYIANRYRIREANRQAYLQALRGGGVSSTDIYESDVGEWISGYAPIRDEAGDIVAVLEVDQQVQRYDRALREKLLIEALVTGAALLVAMMAVLFLAGRLTDGIERLAVAMKRFERGETNVQLELKSQDEIAAMAETFNSMAYSVGEKLKLLPFVSRFTASAVEKSRYLENWLEGHEVEAAVLVTDVRGFTRSSADMAPAELLRRLNDLLALQTEVVHAHGGDVDKFMGDSVLAVFSGGGDALERAVRCACELMSRVQKQTHEWPQGWALGAAVNHGKVVVGAVGSTARRDYTVIGDVVNQAAHLCGAAGAWELLLPPTHWVRLPPELQAYFPAEVPVKTKHREDAVMMRTHQRCGITQTPW